MSLSLSVAVPSTMTAVLARIDYLRGKRSRRHLALGSIHGRRDAQQSGRRAPPRMAAAAPPEPARPRDVGRGVGPPPELRRDRPIAPEPRARAPSGRAPRGAGPPPARPPGGRRVPPGLPR